jgi:hypothetical protein
MALVSSKINSILDALKTNIEADEDLYNAFRDVTRKEFPLCDNYPSCNINAVDTADDIGVTGMSRKLRRVRVNIYVTLNRAALEKLEPDLWDLVDTVRRRVESDRYLSFVNADNLLEKPIVSVDVRSVPSPVGTNYVGTRVLEFDAHYREDLI